MADAPEAVFHELVPLLARDAHAAVRSGVADVLNTRYSPKQLAVLLALAADSEPETRRLALIALTHASDAETVKRTLERFADRAYLVRTQAEETMVTLHRKINVIAFVAAQIDNADESTRYHVARALGRLGAQEFIPNLHERLRQEDNAENIAAVIFALAELNASTTAASVVAFADHADAGVRTQVARAIGAMAVPDTYTVLDKLVFDKKQPVRTAAIRSIGRLHDAHFSPTLKKVLESVRPGDPTSPTDRADACWAASKVRPVSMELMKRILTQGTTPVVPTEMGPVFEGDDVLVSADLALASCARDDKEVLPLFEKMNVMHQTVNEHPSGIGSLMPTAELIEFARQAQLYVQGKTIAPGQRPKSQPLFSYRQTEKNP